MNLALMQVIDQQFLETPFYGVRQMTWHLQNEGHPVNQKRIRRRMRLMVKGIVAPVAPRKPRNDVDLPEAQHQQARQWAQDLPLPSGRTAGRSAQPGLVR